MAGHLLNSSLGGVGGSNNLFPIAQAANAGMAGVEHQVRAQLGGSGGGVSDSVSPSYGSGVGAGGAGAGDMDAQIAMAQQLFGGMY